MIDALKSKDKLRLGALRFVKANLDSLLKDKGSALTDEEVIAALKKRMKQGNDSIEKFTAGNRADLAELENNQLKIISEYLPEQMGEKELTDLVEKVIADAGASSPKDFGKVMGRLMKEVAGRADGKIIKSIVEKKLK